MQLDEAIAKSIEALKEGYSSKFGYDFEPEEVARTIANGKSYDRGEVDRLIDEYYPLIAEAAWELVRRGILRPGVHSYQAQSISGGGYSLTTEGRNRLNDLDNSDLLLLQPGSLADALDKFKTKFGEGYAQRAQEAVKCRNAETWFATCSMVGAAAEAILLSLAIAKTNDEEDVLKMYFSAHGRRRIVNLLTGTAKEHVRKQISTFSGIISLWRDEAAHGQASQLSSANADEALRQLLHMCQWVERNWVALTS